MQEQQGKKRGRRLSQNVKQCVSMQELKLDTKM